MSYLVLARKYRPRTFEDVVGQAPVVRALANALEGERLHHAYLFTGTRGVGKTTLARILAACLNCATGITAKPCGECDACASIAAGRFLDLIEVDAASRTGVEDTRELLSNAQFLPGQGRFKVYLIDEVHMLTGHSFNALLKTLEEPPEHVKFLLATTEAKKIPVTVLSRCLQFNLKNMLPQVIEEQLAKVLAAEDIPAEPEALATIAAAAAGSMRDALSIADQAVSHGAGAVRADSVSAMLGIAGRDEVGALLAALAAKDSARLLAAGDDLAARALDLGAVLGELQRAFADLAVAAELRAAPAPAYERFHGAFSPEDLQLYYQIALMGGRDIDFAPDAKVGFDMTLIRLASFEPTADQAQPPPASADASGAKPPAAAKPSPPHTPSAARPAPPAQASGAIAQRTAPVKQVEAAPPASVQAQAPVSGTSDPPAPDVRMAATGENAAAVDDGAADGAPPAEAPGEPWHAVVAQMAPTGVTAMILNNTNLLARASGAWTILVDQTHETLLNDKQRAEIAHLAAKVEGGEVRVELRLGAPDQETPGARAARIGAERKAKAEALFGGEPLVRALIDEFGARVVSAELVSTS